jgi:hypothetical protein
MKSELVLHSLEYVRRNVRQFVCSVDARMTAIDAAAAVHAARLRAAHVEVYFTRESCRPAVVTFRLHVRLTRRTFITHSPCVHLCPPTGLAFIGAHTRRHTRIDKAD